jgi:hypothetical protein
MTNVNRFIVMAGIAGSLCFATAKAQAQGGPGGGNFDPAQMQQQIQQMLMDNYRSQLEVTNDDEWVVIRPRVQKVLDARTDIGIGGSTGLMGMFGGGRRGGNAMQGGGQAGGGRRGFGALGGLFGTPGPEEQALQTAIDANTPSAALKTALERFNNARKAKQAKLEAAQAELRQVLSVRQEAIASVSGLL